MLVLKIMSQRHTGETSGERHSHWAPVDRYQPCFEIAHGGMATVYLARVTARAGFDRFVALKRIHPHLLKEPGFVEMFMDEAHVASCIVHPNVCSVFDYEVLGDRHYIAMEYLMGEPLSRVRHAMQERAAATSIERACSLVARIIADACEGLHAAHELRDSEGEPLNVVHRDVSPQNLFLTYDGAVKVVDFGLVRTADCLHKTKTGIVKGKFAYLAPEALASAPLDRRADIWGLGVVLWELATQHRLFQRDSETDTILAVATQPIEAPSAVRPGVPAALDKIVLKALDRDPAKRYATARELGRELMRFIHEGADPVGLPDLAEWMDGLFPGGARASSSYSTWRVSSAATCQRSRFRPTRHIRQRPPPTRARSPRRARWRACLRWSPTAFRPKGCGVFGRPLLQLRPPWP